jgi:hypothetical protein
MPSTSAASCDDVSPPVQSVIGGHRMTVLQAFPEHHEPRVAARHDLPRRSPGTACSARSTPITARCRSGCRRSCAGPGSRLWQPPTGHLKERLVPDHNARFAVPAAEPGSALRALCRPTARGRAVHSGGSRGRCRQLRVLCPPQAPDFHSKPTAGTMSASPCGSTNIPTAASPVSTPKESPDMPSRKPLNSARRPRGLWVCGQRKSALPTSPTGPTTEAADI